MEVVVNDTNVLIDLCDAGLLDCCRALALDFRTLDVVMNELEMPRQREAVERLVDSGFLRVHAVTGRQLRLISDMINRGGGGRLSFEDVAVMVYAREHDCRLLTGDKALRERAAREGIKVSGVLFLTDMLEREGVLAGRELAAALRRLMGTNTRLPKALVMERIARLDGE